MTAAERLKQIAGVSGASAASCLRRIGGAAATAGALLVAYSGLPGGAAAQHLLTDRVANSTQNSGGPDSAGWIGNHDRLDRLRAKTEHQRNQSNAAAIHLIIALVASGEFD